MERVTLVISAASGVQYGLRLLERLLAQGCNVDLLIATQAERIINAETDHHIPSYFEAQEDWIKRRYGFAKGIVKLYAQDDWTCPALSGDTAANKMVVCPASGGFLSALACGVVNTPIERAGEVALKENSQFIVVPREAPYTTVHLENMLKLSKMGCTILPASPSFNPNPPTIDVLVDNLVIKIMSSLKIMS